MNELYKQEILELTNLLRNDDCWSDLREILLEKEYNLQGIALAAFMEDDEENEYGAIVTKDKKVIEYVRCLAAGENNINYFKSRDITNLKDEVSKYPQIEAAFEMINNGQILND